MFTLVDYNNFYEFYSIDGAFLKFEGCDYFNLQEYGLMIVKSFTIVTSEANELMSEIHNSKKRMPVILSRENENEWINGQAVLDFAYPDIDFVARAI